MIRKENCPTIEHMVEKLDAKFKGFARFIQNAGRFFRIGTYQIKKEDRYSFWWNFTGNRKAELVFAQNYEAISFTGKNEEICIKKAYNYFLVLKGEIVLGKGGDL